MEVIQLFALQRVPDGSGDSRLLAGERDAGRVEGVVLEAQFRCRAGNLVVTSDDSPFEEQVHFYLVDDSFRRLDDVSLGRIYTPGILRDLSVQTDGDALTFGFFGCDRWQLTVAADPRWGGFTRRFSGVRRSRSWPWRRYLALKRV